MVHDMKSMQSTRNARRKDYLHLDNIAKRSQEHSSTTSNSSQSSSASARIKYREMSVPGYNGYDRDYQSNGYRRRSRSGSPYRRRYSSPAPRDAERNHISRDYPAPASRCIGVFGLNSNTSQRKVRDLFEKYGPIQRVQMVFDAHTQRSRGFCFIYFETISDARVAKDSCAGMEVDGRRIRVDYSITQRPHTPTPGVYMGRSARNNMRPERSVVRYYSRGSPRYRDSKSSSPYSRRKYRRRNSRSRSRTRSRSPRSR